MIYKNLSKSLNKNLITKNFSHILLLLKNFKNDSEWLSVFNNGTWENKGIWINTDIWKYKIQYNSFIQTGFWDNNGSFKFNKNFYFYSDLISLGIWKNKHNFRYNSKFKF